MIRNLIFDFGNVFISLQTARFRRRILLHGILKKDPELLATLHAYEKGALSDDAFLTAVKSKAVFGSKKQLKKSWESMIGKFPEKKLDLLYELNTEYRCFLLSNINGLHEAHIQKKLGDTFYNKFLTGFEKAYYSHHIGMRKPDLEIYEHVLQENNLNPAETLFIDDLAKNIDAAAQLGIQTWHLKKPKDLYTIREKLLTLDVD